MPATGDSGTDGRAHDDKRQCSGERPEAHRKMWPQGGCQRLRSHRPAFAAGLGKDAGIRCDGYLAGTSMVPPRCRDDARAGTEARRWVAGWVRPCSRKRTFGRDRLLRRSFRNSPEGQCGIIIANWRLPFITKGDETCRIHRLPGRYGPGQSGLCSDEFTSFGQRISARRKKNVRIGTDVIMAMVKTASPALADAFDETSASRQIRSRSIWSQSQTHAIAARSVHA